MIKSPTLTFHPNNTLEFELTFWSIYDLIFTCILSPYLTGKLRYSRLKKFSTISLKIPFISCTHFTQDLMFCF